MTTQQTEQFKKRFGPLVIYWTKIISGDKVNEGELEEVKNMTTAERIAAILILQYILRRTERANGALQHLANILGVTEYLQF